MLRGKNCCVLKVSYKNLKSIFFCQKQRVTKKPLSKKWIKGTLNDIQLHFLFNFFSLCRHKVWKLSIRVTFVGNISLFFFFAHKKLVFAFRPQKKLFTTLFPPRRYMTKLKRKFRCIRQLLVSFWKNSHIQP